MSYRDPDGKRAYLRFHPDRILYDPLPGQATKEAWNAIQFDRNLAELEATAKRQRAFAAKKYVDNAGNIV